MRTTFARVLLPLSLSLSCVAAAAQPGPTPQKFALLVGIDTYKPAGATMMRPPDAPAIGRFARGVSISNLQGPQYDIENMRGLLTTKFGFVADHIHTLKDGAATHRAIVDALNAYLIQQPKAGDTVVFYVSGHGSLRVNRKGSGRTFDLDGTGKLTAALDSTLVTADAYLGADDITSRELRRLFNQAADKGIHVTAIFDTCHSGGQARGVGDAQMVPRTVLADPRDMDEAPDTLADGSPVVAPEDRAENPVLVLSAAQQDQSALDVQNGVQPHGLFTQALIDALQGLPATASADDVYKQVLVNVEHAPGAGDQQPALDASAARRRQPLFGGAASNGPARAAVVEVKGDQVVLDIGPAAGIGVGSTFVSWPERANPVELRVEEPLSISRSRAVMVQAGKAALDAGDLVSLERWVHPPAPTATFFVGPANLTGKQILATLDALRAVKIAFVEDPSAQPWTHLLFWNGAAWQLKSHTQASAPGAAAPPAPADVMLGAMLDAAALSRQLPADAVLWFDPPVPAELAKTLLIDPDSAAVASRDRRSALYVAAGVGTTRGISYGWYNRSGFDTQEQTPAGYGHGCSARSPYPLRTEWFPLQPDQANAAADSLNSYASRIVKLDSWLSLQSPDGAGSFPYSLVVRDVANDALLKSGDATYKDQRLNLVLTSSADAPAVAARWVYVLGIDCQGRGQLVWPSGGPGGRFPSVDGGRLAMTPLAQSGIRVTPPFGTDTFILITTSTQLPDAGALDFEGTARGLVSDPLAALLQTRSSGTRGISGDAPTDWGIQMLQLQSNPTAAPVAAARAASRD